MELDVHNRSYAFVEVKPRIDRDREKHIVDLAFDVGEGPRVYVERIDIVGNTRTKDKVIRREFRLAEGDALNADAVRRSRERLRNLNYFNDVKITPVPGSVPDKAVLTATVDEKATGELTLGGGYSTDAGALLDIGLSERNLVGSGVSAGINGVLAQKRSSITASITDPYFLDRNLVVGGDIFLIQTNFLGTEPYDEKRVGFDVRAGYDFNEYLRQVWSYSLVGRTVYNVAPNASFFIQQLSGYTLLSQVSQSLSLDHRDSKTDPHTGYLVTLGTDFAGLGGDVTLRPRQHQRPVFHSARPFHREQRLGYRPDGGHRLSVQRGQAGADHRPLLPRRRQPSRLPDRRRRPARCCHGRPVGRAVHLDPVDASFASRCRSRPISGCPGRAFVDIGGLTEASFVNPSLCREATGAPCVIADFPAPRVGIGVGISWHTQFGLLNVDLTPFVIKQPFDQTQIFRFGFGTRF